MTRPEWRSRERRRYELLNAKSWLAHPGPVELPDRVRQWMHDHFADELDKARRDGTPDD